MTPTYLAVDFGGGSGRVIAATIQSTANEKVMKMQEVHRFENRCVNIGGFLYWDFPALFANMLEGLKKAALTFSNVVSIGIDTWGVDFALIDKNGNLLGNPLCYRDPHTTPLPGEYSSVNDLGELYEKTGIQTLPINTLFQLWGMAKRRDPKLDVAHRLLFMPDLFGFYLTGIDTNEYTIATTSQLVNARLKDWDLNVIGSIGINPSIFGKIVFPGQMRGNILPDIAAETGLSTDVRVVNVASHDTASAVFAAAEPFQKSPSAFISSGTWSLLGVVINEPILSEKARIKDFTNEGGADNRICFLSNITGLWILQQLKKQWEEQGQTVTWSSLTQEGWESKNNTVIDVTDSRFSTPLDMERKITDFCNERGLEMPLTRGDFVRCVCRSLAVSYKKAIEELNELLPSGIQEIKIFGGGANNSLLNEFTKEYTRLKITTGPSEATAIGNLLVQAIAHGEIQNKNDIKEFTGL